MAYSRRRRPMVLKRLPSEATLGQRMDQLGTRPIATLHEESARLVTRQAPAVIACHDDWIPLNIA